MDIFRFVHFQFN